MKEVGTEREKGGQVARGNQTADEGRGEGKKKSHIFRERTGDKARELKNRCLPSLAHQKKGWLMGIKPSSEAWHLVERVLSHFVLTSHLTEK